MESIGLCRLCPRNCGADREHGKTGYCVSTNTVRLSRAALHMWEEPCISGENGSGAVFFSGCNLRCVFCQNHDIADGTIGKEVSIERLSAIFLELQEKKAHNINLVTPGHYVMQIIPAIKLAKEKGLRIPIVYNTNAYEKVETLKQLEGLVDIYLPDMKYISMELSQKYSNAPDYALVAKEAIAEMVRQTGEVKFDDKGIIKLGTIVRHLILPGHTVDSKAVIAYLYRTYGDRIYISIMNQYTPMPQLREYPELNRRVTKLEYKKVVDYALGLGVENGFIQEGSTAKESFIPVFDYEGV